MIRYLLYHPIAVCVITLALTALGIIALLHLPVSLLPDIPFPEITVQANYSSASARELQRTIEQPLRNQLLQINHLDGIESITQNGQTTLKLRFNYGIDMRLAYLETNEKIDGILSQLPRDFERPRVIKAGAGDIPVFNFNILPGPNYREDFLTLSEFCENVIKRRIEQIPDVALVDATGLSQAEVIVQADPSKLVSIGITEQQLADVLKQANLQPGNFSVQEGPYQYNIRFSSVLKTPQDVENIYFSIGGISPVLNGETQNDPRVIYFANNVLTARDSHLESPRRLIALREVATVSMRERPLTGSYTFYKKNSYPRRSICLGIIKQNDSQLLHLRGELNKLQEQFRKDYPQIQFALSQDQTELLNVSINNLVSNLLVGALLTFCMIFFFMHDRRLPILIGLVIPISIFITFLGFYLLKLSINIVSLAGLVLGMGEIVDSAIIILENIEEKRDTGVSVSESCIVGAEEVIRPLFTSVLTNSAVFLPLLLLSGLAGALFFDQAISVSLALGISLLCSYILVPVLYYLLYRKETGTKIIHPISPIMRIVDRVYNVTFSIAFQFKRYLVIGLVIFLGIAYWMAIYIHKQGMPSISRTELEVYIDWNEPLSVAENQRRTENLIRKLKPKPEYISAFIGQQQFILNQSIQQSENETLLSIQTNSKQAYESLSSELIKNFKEEYPIAVINCRPSRNVFEQLFNTTEPRFRLKLYNMKGQQPIDLTQAQQISNELIKLNVGINSIGEQRTTTIKLLSDKSLLYDVDESAILQKLKTIFNNNLVTNLPGEHQSIPLVISRLNTTYNTLPWQKTFVYNRKQQTIPLQNLLEVTPQSDYKIFYADKQGAYVPIDFPGDSLNIDQLQQHIEKSIKLGQGVEFVWSGQYFRDQSYLTELLWIMGIALILLFCILTAQFESVQQPLIVLLIILLGLSGAVWSLYTSGESLNILSVIGMIVLIGLLDNDSILKIDTMNRSIDSMSLLEAIRSSGQRRLKSQVMTFLTTVLGLLPVLFSGGLGSELQRPLAITVIGGMCVGMLLSWTVIPLLYWRLAMTKKVHNNPVK